MATDGPEGLLSLVESVPEVLEEHLGRHLSVATAAGMTRCCRGLRALVTSRRFMELKYGECSVPYVEGRSLQQLHVLQMTRDLPRRVYHKGIWADVSDAANLVPAAAAPLNALAAVLRRHSQATVEVHSHISVNNPPFLASFISQQRARVVREELERRGVQPEQVHLVSWGGEVAHAAGWETLDSARSELFVLLEGVSFPPRPSYYEGVAPPQQTDSESIHSHMHVLNSIMTSHLDGMGLESESDDDGMGYLSTEYEDGEESDEGEEEP